MMMNKVFKTTIYFVLLLIILSSCTLINKKGKWINTNIEGNLLPKKPSEKDDFYQAVNYEKLKNQPLEAGMTTAGGQGEINKILSSQIAELAERTPVPVNPSKADSEKEKLISLYNMCLDWEKRNELGIQPILPIIKKIQNIESTEDFTELFNDDEIRIFFPVSINSKNNDGFRYAPEIKIHFQFDRNLKACNDFYKSMLKKIGFENDEAAEIINSAYDFEKQYNSNFVSNKKSQASSLYFNNIKREYQNFPLADFLKAYGVADMTYLISQSEELKTFDSLFTNENLQAIKNLCILKILLNSASLLDKESYEYASLLVEQINGQSFSFEADGAVLHILNSYVPSFLGKVWYQEFTSPEVIADVEKLTLEIVEGYKNQIANWTWLNSSSRYTISELLGRTKVIVGANSFFDYSDYKVEDNLPQSIIKLVLFESASQVEKCHKELDIYDWLYPPQIYNAFYNPSNDSINIYAGYIYGSHYDINATTEEKYGHMGTMIAHEISHIFSLYGGNDNAIIQRLNANDHKALQERLDSMADYFSNFEVFPGKKCKSQQCKGEIGADIFGMDTLLKIVAQKDSFDYRLFFEAYAKTNFAKYTEQLNLTYYEKDSHPSYFLRTNAVLQQFDEFYQAFDIKKGDGMYLSQNKRVLK